MNQEELKTKCTQNADGTFKCNACGSDIMAVEQKRSVWEFPEAMAGSGRVVTESVPYCPKCEPKPSDRGPPITPR